MTEPLTDERFAEIQAMRFTTGVNAATGVFDTPVERELYELAARNYNARLELAREVERLRELVAQPELANWAEQLQSADLTPHPAFAWCGTTTGYEAAVQVATTDRLTIVARERLLTELRLTFDETVRRVLGYHPATPTT
jgi:hypothetical protein